MVFHAQSIFHSFCSVTVLIFLLGLCYFTRLLHLSVISVCLACILNITFTTCQRFVPNVCTFDSRASSYKLYCSKLLFDSICNRELQNRHVHVRAHNILHHYSRDSALGTNLCTCVYCNWPVAETVIAAAYMNCCAFYSLCLLLSVVAVQFYISPVVRLTIVQSEKHFWHAPRISSILIKHFAACFDIAFCCVSVVCLVLVAIVVPQPTV